MATSYQIKIHSFDVEGNKTANKTFSKLTEVTSATSSAGKALVNKYAALTDAANTTAEHVTTADIDLG